MKNLMASRSDVVLRRGKNNTILILNRETGSWFVGCDENNEIGKLFSDNGEIDGESEIVKKLKNQNILCTDKNMVKIEQPYSDELGLLILDTTNTCNLRCKYCFVNATDKGIMMSLEIALNALKKALEYPKCADVLTVEFSGGEPLLNYSMIKKFIPKACEIAHEKNKGLSFTIQTNGTLLNDEVIDFLIANKVNVGISIDGTEEFHDRNRIFANGMGSLEVIKKNIHLFQKKGGHVSILAVITSVRQYDSIIKFAIDNNIVHIRTNLVSKIGRADNKEEYNLEYLKLADKFVDVADEILSRKINIKDATLSFYLWNLLLFQPHMCFRSPCGSGKNQISVTANGDIYSCQEWRNINDGAIGNVGDKETLENVLKKSFRVQELNNRNVRNLEICQTCDWKAFCGICPREIYSERNSINGKIPHCDFQNRVFEKLLWKFYDQEDAVRNYLVGQ